MSVAYELGKSEEEIMHWPASTLKRWWTFFIVRSEEEAKAFEEAKAKAAAGGSRRTLRADPNYPVK